VRWRLANLARKHRNTPVVARTWLQHALTPMPFGLKWPNMPAALHRSRGRLQRLRRETLALQFRRSPARSPPWTQRIAGRRRWRRTRTAIARGALHTSRPHCGSRSVFAILAAPAAKSAGDIQLMMQTDVGEAFEPAGEGRGGSSTCRTTQSGRGCDRARAAMMPQFAATIFAAQIRITKGSAGPWHAEAADRAGAAAGHFGRACRHCRYRRGRGSRCGANAPNLDASGGLIMAEA